jgi:sarcosine oxidase subunit delta
MSFTITCPICGARDIYEFHYGGQERGPQPDQKDLSAEDHFRYCQFRKIGAEPLEEWWYHAAGCGSWFTTRRDPTANRELSQEGDDDG